MTIRITNDNDFPVVLPLAPDSVSLPAGDSIDVEDDVASSLNQASGVLTFTSVKA